VYRFLLRPAWLLSHVLVLLLIVSLFNLGLWQLRRLDERQQTNEEIQARAEADPVDLAAVVSSGESTDVGGDLRFTEASATGSYDADRQVLLRSRSLDGRPGFWVLTPLVTDAGPTLVVNRGWIPFESETDASDIEFETPTGSVAVTGLVQESVGPAKAADGERTTIAHADLDWFEDELGVDVYPVYLQLQDQEPAPGELPVVLPAPDLGEGPHFGYAMQWFIFTAIAVVGYPIVLYKVAHGRGREGRNRPPEYDDAIRPARIGSAEL
jgi:cytochrome oxidase assembly protein ShyY1